MDTLPRSSRLLFVLMIKTLDDFFKGMSAGDENTTFEYPSY